MDDPVLQLVTRGVFILVFCLTLRDFVRWRDVPRLEIAALFGSLAVIITLQALGEAINIPDWANTAGILAFLAQPYLLLRVLGQFRKIPTSQHRIALGCLAATCGLYLIWQAKLPAVATLAIVLAFAYVESYSTVGFIRTARQHAGITRRRLIAIALGSASLAGVILVAGAAAFLPSQQSLITPIIDALGLGSALGYYLGAAPPRWLRRIWQGFEVEQFLIGLSGLSGSRRVASILEYLGPAAARATGGSATIIALGRDSSSSVLDLHADPATTAQLQIAKVGSLTLNRSPVLSQAWRTGSCLAAGPDDDWGWELNCIADVTGARALMIAPLVAGERAHGVFIVLVERASLFVSDDLAILAVLADQASLAIESARLLEDSIRERSTLTAITSSMHEGLLVMDQQYALRYCNSRAAELIGIPQSTLHEASAISLFTKVQDRLADAETVFTRWKQALRNPERRTTLDMELANPPRSLQAEIFPVADPGGGQRGVGVVLRDVTAERDLVRTKDELVSVVSHELRTPLASVVGFAELLRTRELTDAQRQQFLTVILEEGRRLTALINDFLDLQRMETGRQEISPRQLDLPDLLSNTVEAAGPDEARPIELDLPDELPAVRADPDRIHQVMSNLLSNARKYSPGGGPIRVSASEDDGQVIVSVRDSGLGMPPEALPRLFEKFFRIDNSDRRSITGTGLGLAISRKIIEAHGGRIWADSEGLGHGSRFSFSLPVANARSTSGDVLIIEDDAGFARLLEAELADRSISSAWVASAEEALEQLEIHRPRALVLDLLLPGLQGEAFLENLCTRHGWTGPVVIVTVKDLTQSERAALNRLNVKAILRKQPDVGAAAAEIVDDVLRNRDSQHRHGVAA
jgi:signal transduction histidine kinase/CheY-like chemotaxis protein